MSLEYRRIEGRLIKQRRLKPLEFDEHRVVFHQIRNATQRIARIRCDAEKHCLKRIEQRERFRGTHPVVVTAKAEGVFSYVFREIIHELKSALPVEIWIAAVHADGELVRYLHAGDRTRGGEIIVTVAILNAEFGHHRWVKC